MSCCIFLLTIARASSQRSRRKRKRTAHLRIGDEIVFRRRKAMGKRLANPQHVVDELDVCSALLRSASLITVCAHISECTSERAARCFPQESIPWIYPRAGGDKKKGDEPFFSLSFPPLSQSPFRPRPSPFGYKCTWCVDFTVADPPAVGGEPRRCLLHSKSVWVSTGKCAQSFLKMIIYFFRYTRAHLASAFSSLLPLPLLSTSTSRVCSRAP